MIVLLPSKFLLGYNFETYYCQILFVLLPSKFLLGYNLIRTFTNKILVLLPSKFLLGWNYKERTYYELVIFYKYSIFLKIKTDKSKRCRPSPKRERGLHLWCNYTKAFYFSEGSWTVFLIKVKIVFVFCFEVLLWCWRNTTCGPLNWSALSISLFMLITY